MPVTLPNGVIYGTPCSRAELVSSPADVPLLRIVAGMIAEKLKRCR